MDQWLAYRKRGLGIMNAFPYNKTYSNPNVIRFEGEKITDEIKEALKRQLDRKSLQPFQI
jgi:hypothetical protein